MGIKRVTMLLGIFLTAFGLAGFIPNLLQSTRLSDPVLTLYQGYGRLFGVFPVNVGNSVIHFVMGIWGLLAADQVLSSRRFCRFTAYLYGLLAIIGLIPLFNTCFGMLPLFGNDVWMHAGVSAIAACFAYVSLPEQRSEQRVGV